MYIDLTEEEASLLADAIKSAGLTRMPMADDLHRRLMELHNPDGDQILLDETYAEQAKEIYTPTFADGEIQWDERPIVSKSDGGAYVMTWLWVGDDEEDLEDLGEAEVIAEEDKDEGED